MPTGWKRLDLKGGGLQDANLRLAKALRRRPTAWLLLAGAPLGLHRLYLGDRRGALGCLALTLASVLVGWAVGAFALLLPLALMAVEAFRLESLIARANRRIRMALFLRRDAAPPPGYRGRSFGAAEDAREAMEDYLREKDRETPGHQPPGDTPGPGRRQLSFAEQERLLKEMARRREDS